MLHSSVVICGMAVGRATQLVEQAAPVLPLVQFTRASRGSWGGTNRRHLEWQYRMLAVLVLRLPAVQLHAGEVRGMGASCQHRCWPSYGEALACVKSLQKYELARQVSHAEHWTSIIFESFKYLKRQRIQTAGSHSCWQLARPMQPAAASGGSGGRGVAGMVLQATTCVATSSHIEQPLYAPFPSAANWRRGSLAVGGLGAGHRRCGAAELAAAWAVFHGDPSHAVQPLPTLVLLTVSRCRGGKRAQHSDWEARPHPAGLLGGSVLSIAAATLRPTIRHGGDPHPCSPRRHRKVGLSADALPAPLAAPRPTEARRNASL